MLLHPPTALRPQALVDVVKHHLGNDLYDADAYRQNHLTCVEIHDEHRGEGRNHSPANRFSDGSDTLLFHTLHFCLRGRSISRMTFPTTTY